MLMNAAGDCFFYFLPLILGFNFAKKLPDRSILRTDPGSCNVLSGNSECRHQFIGEYVVNTTYTSTFLRFIWSSAAVPLYKWFVQSSFRRMIKGFN